MPKVSIIIPVYNTALYLKDCLDSIVEQTLEDIEIICINDGSTDSSFSILSEYKHNDSRILLIDQENSGQASARNTGLKSAKGEYIYFMDSDDILSKDALFYLYEECKKNNLDVIYFDGDAIYDSFILKEKHPGYMDYYKRKKSYSNVYKGCDLFVELHKDNAYRVSPCLQFIKRQYLLSGNLFFPEHYIYEDNLFSLKCMLGAERVSHRNIPLFHRRIRENSTITMEITHKNVCGYIYCFLGIQSYIYESHIPNDICSYVDVELAMTINNAARFYIALGEKEKKDVLNSLRGFEFFINNFFVPYTQKKMLPDRQKTFDDNWVHSEIQKIYASKSFKIGRLITYIPRKIRDYICMVKK